jgi:threonine/homoserine/homoserine lactone efflux protein
MTSVFVEGLLAGYGIAIPVGAITVLIVETTLRKGFGAGLAAASGTATADFIYAALAAAAGSVLAGILEPYMGPVRIVSSLVLVGMGIWGMQRSLRSLAPEQISEPEDGNRRLYIQFLFLTAVNPLTIVYFSALILAGTVGEASTFLERTLFVLGAGFASLSWQSLLAVVGALLRKGISDKVRLGLSLVGNLVVVGLGLRLLLR